MMERELTVCFFTDLHLTSGDDRLPGEFYAHPAYRGFSVSRLRKAVREAHRRYKALLETLCELRDEGRNLIGVCGGDLVPFGNQRHETRAVFLRVKREVQEALAGAPLVGIVGNHDAEEDYRGYLEIFGDTPYILVGKRTVLFFLDAVSLLPSWVARITLPALDYGIWRKQREMNLKILEMAEALRQEGRSQQLAFLHLGWVALNQPQLRRMSHLIFGHHHFGFSLYLLPNLPSLHQVGGMDFWGWRERFKSQVLLVEIDTQERVTVVRRPL